MSSVSQCMPLRLNFPCEFEMFFDCLLPHSPSRKSSNGPNPTTSQHPHVNLSFPRCSLILLVVPAAPLLSRPFPLYNDKNTPKTTRGAEHCLDQRDTLTRFVQYGPAARGQRKPQRGIAVFRRGIGSGHGEHGSPVFARGKPATERRPSRGRVLLRRGEDCPRTDPPR